MAMAARTASELSQPDAIVRAHYPPIGTCVHSRRKHGSRCLFHKLSSIGSRVRRIGHTSPFSFQVVAARAICFLSIQLVCRLQTQIDGCTRMSRASKPDPSAPMLCFPKAKPVLCIRSEERRVGEEC